jgi:hypothetical protein
VQSGFNLEKNFEILNLLTHHNLLTLHFKSLKNWLIYVTIRESLTLLEWAMGDGQQIK